VESPVLSNGHAGFGGRPEETDQPKGSHRTSGRPNRNQGKRPIPATICLARRRTNILYAVIRDNRTWQPESPPIAKAAA
jgi:hypothetical protein